MIGSHLDLLQSTKRMRLCMQSHTPSPNALKQTCLTFRFKVHHKGTDRSLVLRLRPMLVWASPPVNIQGKSVGDMHLNSQGAVRFVPKSS